VKHDASAGWLLISSGAGKIPRGCVSPAPRPAPRFPPYTGSSEYLFLVCRLRFSSSHFLARGLAWRLMWISSRALFALASAHGSPRSHRTASPVARMGRLVSDRISGIILAFSWIRCSPSRFGMPGRPFIWVTFDLSARRRLKSVFLDLLGYPAGESGVVQLTTIRNLRLSFLVAGLSAAPGRSLELRCGPRRG